MNQNIQLHPSWLAALSAEFDMPYMQKLKSYLEQRKQSGARIYPIGSQYFSALNTTPLEQVKVVILGQDPYHGPNQAHGLSFSVPVGERIPPSLRNIYKELHDDLGITIPAHGHLQAWAEQGVLLLNSVLTVEDGQAGAHQGQGWEQFTDAVIAVINQQRQHVVFLLWGSYAQKKGCAIDKKKHLVLQAPHPSPLSAHRGFLGCKHFSKTNTYLQQYGQMPIEWSLPDIGKAPKLL
ncbi:MAG: uracil-DNA glycosylase [Zetaproteobacteria bacterium CG2_30_46_52]|nr:MAG: uracil-DNA glycosylase [Zetaproteobacteria bacterium CG2_30_46_52]